MTSRIPGRCRRGLYDTAGWTLAFRWVSRRPDPRRLRTARSRSWTTVTEARRCRHVGRRRRGLPRSATPQRLVHRDQPSDGDGEYVFWSASGSPSRRGGSIFVATQSRRHRQRCSRTPPSLGVRFDGVTTTPAGGARYRLRRPRMGWRIVRRVDGVRMDAVAAGAVECSVRRCVFRPSARRGQPLAAVDVIVLPESSPVPPRPGSRRQEGTGEQHTGPSTVDQWAR